MNNPFKALIDVAAAVVTELNAGVSASAFSTSFAAARTYDAALEVEDGSADELRVDVVPGDIEITPVTIAKAKAVCHADIAVRKAILVNDTSGVDALVTLAGEIYAYLAGSGDDGAPRPLSTYTDSNWEWPDNERQPVPYVPHILKHGNVFTAIITTRYVVHV